MAEWTKAAVLKTAVRVTVPGVRIPPHPLLLEEFSLFFDEVVQGLVFSESVSFMLEAP